MTPPRHGRILMRGALLAVVTLLLWGAFAPASARVRVFVGGVFGAPAPYPYWAPYPYPYYYPPYPYVDYSVPPPGWEAGHWEWRRDAWGRGVWVWVPGHLR
ncbi:MAG: hypothetical protein E6J68_00630 [Deltaproteobacteria bacterium]|nr:MAG: hypothetical protein E6J68_00630 [Deltaproteobacteria bacterium]TMA71204.1 MAG: hypothetical protein E6J69_00245 [Deltaproteobacteria bacterium]TMB42782.1 MAG: hypothetical protein E6J55_14845 [Deltaproteobacteria bacterium]